MSNENINERGMTSDVSTFDQPLTPIGTFYNKPYFILTRSEFNSLIKKNTVPQRIVNYANTNKTNDLYMKYDKVVFNLNRFFNIK